MIKRGVYAMPGITWQLSHPPIRTLPASDMLRIPLKPLGGYTLLWPINFSFKFQRL